MSVSDKVVVVSDATHEIGEQIVTEFAKRGAHAFSLVNEKGRLADVRSKFSSDGIKADVALGDMVNAKDFQKLVSSAIDRHGRVDVLVNTQHTEGEHPVMDSHELSLEDWDAIYNVNLRASFVACQVVLPHMIRQRGGVILQITSTTALQAAAGMNANNSASAAAVQMCRGLAVEYQKYNIRVNAVVVAGTWHASSLRIREGYARRHTGEDLVRPADMKATVMPERDLSKIAQGFVALATDEAVAITGGVISMDGCLSSGLAVSALLENASIGKWEWPR
jgi:NAD(P)-dependent dehydrogenase (short-subunit alcohol dehydrogenase family)